jgi:glutathione synthase/RimK-type ligase-like ATP-grasp enzyme
VNITVLHYPSERKENWSLLSRAAKARGLHLITWAPHLIEIWISDTEERVCYAGRPASPGIVIHRTVSPFLGIVRPALACLAEQGTLVLNNPDAAFITRDKLLTSMVLRGAQVPIVPTVAFDEPSRSGLKRLGNGAMILKPAHGVRGEGIEVMSLDGISPLAARLRAGRDKRPRPYGHHVQREHYLAQPLVRGGVTDLRAYVVDGTCIALMRRQALPGEVRANLALGASATPLSLGHPAARTAASALTACGLDFGGVDMVEDGDGTVRVLEVDAWAGFAGITAATGADVAGAILDCAVARRPKGATR